MHKCVLPRGYIWLAYSVGIYLLANDPVYVTQTSDILTQHALYTDGTVLSDQPTFL